jgi:hypothetical protein
LKFASRAKTITNRPELNEIVSDQALLKQYKKEIESLKKELNILKTADTKSTQNSNALESQKLLETKLETFNQIILDGSSLRKANISQRRKTWHPISSACFKHDPISGSLIEFRPIQEESILDSTSDDISHMDLENDYTSEEKQIQEDLLDTTMTSLCVDVDEKPWNYIDTVSSYNAEIQQLKAKNELLQEFYGDREARLSEELMNTRRIAEGLESLLTTYMTHSFLLDAKKDILENELVNLRTAHKCAIRDIYHLKKQTESYKSEVFNIVASSLVSSILDSVKNEDQEQQRIIKGHHSSQNPSIGTQTPHSYKLDIHTQTDVPPDDSISSRTRNKTEKVSFQHLLLD